MSLWEEEEIPGLPLSLCVHQGKAQVDTERRQLCAAQEEGPQIPVLLAPWRWTSRLQYCKIINFYALSHPACGILLQRIE